MGKQYAKFLGKTIRSNALAVRFDEQEESENFVSVRSGEQTIRSNEQKEIRELFRMAECPAKIWVSKINGVKPGERYFQKMMSGECEILERLIPQLKRIGTLLLIERRNAIDSFLYEKILEAYGPAGQNMIDNGGADY